jgi:hypothetical protein
MNYTEMKFDVTDTLGRVASSLLQKGISIQTGANAATDGQSIIFIPQAMRKSLTAMEMELVRFMLAHETSHIKHSSMNDASKMVDVIERDLSGHASGLIWTVVQFLEDLRVNQRHAMSYAGGSQTIKYGNAAVKHEWLEEKSASEERTWYQALGEVLYLGHYHPEFRCAETNPCIKSHHVFNALAEILPMIDREVPNLGSTAQLGTYVKKVVEMLSLAADDTTPPNPPQEKGGEGGDGPSDGKNDEPGEGPGSGKGSEMDNYKPMCRELETVKGVKSSGQGYWGDGVVESVIKSSLTASGDEEEVDIREIRKAANFNGDTPVLEKVNDMGRQPSARCASSNYRRGAAMAGGMTEYINLLKGMTRCDFGTPKITGVKINRRSVPQFLRGLTDRVLSKRVKKARRGTACVFLVDDSGSMRGDGSDTVWTSAATFCVACERAQIPVAIIRYSAVSILEKSFSTPSRTISARFAGCLWASTNLQSALKVGSYLLSSRREERKVIFALTDGLTGSVKEELQEAARAGYEVIPILFGPGGIRGKKNFVGFDPILIPDITKPIASRMVRALIARG